MLELTITPRAIKGLSRIPERERSALMSLVRQFAKDPRTPNLAKKLKNRPEFTIRYGTWRALVMPDFSAGTLLLLDAGHRRLIYG
jgi:mRNA-degrading endonuclease RelE of RelBE toxin-antitoxin system